MGEERRENWQGKTVIISRLPHPNRIHPSVADDMAAHGKSKPTPAGAPAPPPPPPPPPPPSVAEAKKGFMRRMFPFLLAVNLFVGGQHLTSPCPFLSSPDLTPLSCSLNQRPKIPVLHLLLHPTDPHCGRKFH
jgi:hypothetical protein